MLAMKMAQSSPDALAAELSSLSESQQEKAVTHLARTYSSTNPENVANWINSMESGSVRDAALTTSLSSLRHTDIKQAFSLSTTLEDFNTKRNEIQQTLLEWVTIDPVAAMSALNASSISEDLKQGIRQNIAAQNPAAQDYLLPAKAQ